MESATKILDLPTNPANSPNAPPQPGNGLYLNAQEIPTTQTKQEIHSSFDASMMQDMMNALHQASISGATQLPSRDIPMNPGYHSQDPEANTNYIPSNSKTNQIENEWERQRQMHMSKEEMHANYRNRVKMQQSMDDLYEEIYGPLLVTIVIFIFQLPSFKIYLFSFFPVLFSGEGNYNIYGYLFSSILFGLCYYLLQKCSIYFGNKLI